MAEIHCSHGFGFVYGDGVALEAEDHPSGYSHFDPNPVGFGAAALPGSTAMVSSLLPGWYDSEHGDWTRGKHDTACSVLSVRTDANRYLSAASWEGLAQDQKKSPCNYLLATSKIEQPIRSGILTSIIR